jgi:hypothetical protein
MSYGITLLDGFIPVIPYKLISITVFPFLWMFLFASFISEHRDTLLPWLTKNWLILFCVAIIFYFIRVDINIGYGLLRSISLAISLIGFAYAVPQLNIKTDISYGVYIYHMTFVNILIQMGYLRSLWQLVIVTVLTFAFAWLSTKTIGEYCAKKK